VEEVALTLEREGLPRMPGRIYGWCLICDPPLQTAGDLARVLGASKGSISAMTALLVRAELIQRVARPGDRRDYYCVRPGSMSALMADGVRRIAAMRQAIDRGLDLLHDKLDETRGRLQDVHDVLAFFEREYPALLQRWEDERRAKR
jgi:DNA-binding transcriptional regulator GbsR (MarR family)